MSSKRTNSFEQFLMLFDALRHATQDSPERLKAFYLQHQALTTAANALFVFIGIGDFERRVFHSPKKYHPQVPKGFEKSFKEYKKRWEPELYATILPLLYERLGADVGDEDIEGFRRLSVAEVDKPDPETEDHFNPLKHDGAAAFRMALDVAESIANLADTNDAHIVNIEARIGLEAYDYLAKTIGFDLEGVFRRWRKVPVILMPAHVSNRHGLDERGSIYELIDDAVRAYVFGAPAAAMAMCRAILEMLLKEHYGLEYQETRADGRKRDKPLGELIVLAEERYHFLRSKPLRKLAHKANTIMHSHSQNGPLSEDDERSIVRFLETIKFVAERAPELQRQK